MAMKCLEMSDVYTSEQILKAKYPECMELRAILVSSLVKCGLTDKRISTISGLSLQQIYRAKQKALEYGTDNHTYNRLVPILGRAIDNIKDRQANTEHDISDLISMAD
jgi:uncharacterized protein YerC